jgi:tRNA(adenine34) deaminase
MDAALEEAGGAPAHGDVPIGAVVARGPGLEIVAARHNERERTGDPSAHAELLALRDAAAQVDGWRLSDHVLVVTLEPCPMCAGAAWAARVDGIAFGAPDPKAGAAGSLYSFASDPRLNHASWIVGGIRAQECAALLEKFFAPLRGE